MKLKYICQYCSKELTRHNNLLKHEKLCKLNPNILNSGVDLTKYGWVNKVSKITNLSRREINYTVNYFDDLKNKVFYRK